MDLLSKKARIEFRQFFTTMVLREIDDFFNNHSVAFNPLRKVSDFEYVFFSLQLTLKFKHLKKKNRLKTENHFLKVGDFVERYDKYRKSKILNKEFEICSSLY